MLDEELLARLDLDEEVRSEGRSAVIRDAIADYLRRKRSRRITEAYRKAYGAGAAMGEDFALHRGASEGREQGEFAGWEGEGAWPDP